MQEFCSLCVDYTKDNSDTEEDAVNYMFNQFIDEKDGYYYALEIIQSDHSLVVYNATFSRNASQHQACKCLEQSILKYLAIFYEESSKTKKMKKCNKRKITS